MTQDHQPGNSRTDSHGDRNDDNANDRNNNGGNIDHDHHSSTINAGFNPNDHHNRHDGNDNTRVIASAAGAPSQRGVSQSPAGQASAEKPPAMTSLDAEPVSPRWLSRKFITALVAQLAALAALMWPSQGPTLMHASQDLAALLVLVLTALGYIHAEASIDRQRSREVKPPTPEQS